MKEAQPPDQKGISMDLLNALFGLLALTIAALAVVSTLNGK
jgi:hypothetical protein